MKPHREFALFSHRSFVVAFFCAVVLVALTFSNRLLSSSAASARPSAVMAGVIPVTSTSGGTGVVGVCTLRDAITAANTDAPFGGCPAGNGADVITLPANATIMLTDIDNTDIFNNGLPIITSVITIQGNNATITRTGGNKFRFFQVNSGGDLTLDNLTLSNGFAGGLIDTQGGGAIHNNGGKVTLLNSTFTGNEADVTNYHDGGVYESENNASSLIVDNCLFSNNRAGDDGGAIENNFGDYTITNSLFLNNTAGIFGSDGEGGAIRDRSDIAGRFLSACTFSGNRALLGGAVLFGGASFAFVTNCTFFNNTATESGGAIRVDSSDVEVIILNCTIVGNTAPTGAGVRRSSAGGRINMFNTIVANNSGGGSNCSGGGFNQQSGNLEFPGAATCGTATIGDPLLGPLQYNGGPLVGATGSQTGLTTMMPQPGSAAIDTADNAFAPPTDERGVARPVGPIADIGAVEFGTAPLLEMKIGDPAVCLDPNGLIGVTATVTNPNALGGPATFTVTLPAGVTAVAGTCTADINPGGCTIAANGGSLSWMGNLNAGQSVNIIYRARIGANVVPGTQLCLDDAATIFGLTTRLLHCFSVNCPLTNTRVSDQKPGSVLVFPYYTSTIGGASDTRLTISNISNAASTVANQTYVHLFFIDGTTCQQQDLFLCLTPNASFSFKASEYDPGNTGYVIAVVVNNQGVPIQNNVLIGNAFVNTPDFADNYGAESFAANSFAVATVDGNTATLYFDQTGYDAVPKQFTAEIQSPLDAAGQQVVTAGLSGNLTTSQVSGAAQVSTGLAFNEKEAFTSFTAWLTGTCQAKGTVSTTSPRVPGGLGNLIKSGQAGSLKFNVGAAVGLLMTPRTATWKGIRTLHKTQTVATTLTIPIFVPVC